MNWSDFNHLSWVVVCIAELQVFLLLLYPPVGHWGRRRAAFFGFLLAIAYFTWRVDETIWPYRSEPGADIVWMWVVLVLEFLTFYELFLLMVLTFFSANRSAELDQVEASEAGQAYWPSVDLFIPTYDEPLEVLERTILHALEIDYPDFQVWVLDDGRRDWLRDFCAEHGAMYLRRDSNAHAKSGNMNNALRFSKAELIAILDADFSAFKSFLRRPVKFFLDPKIGIVQMPQSFFNPDPIQHNIRVYQNIPDEQRLWFGDILEQRDMADLATSCGSCSIVRREALKLIGDEFPYETITEDFDLSLRLLEHGIVTRYLNETHAVGLSAESMKAFVIQRQRWAKGNLQAWFMFFKRGFKTHFRMPWPKSLIIFDWRYFVVIPARLILLFAPALYLYFGLTPVRVEYFQELLIVQLAFLLSQHVHLLFTTQSRQPLLVAEATSILVAFSLVPTLFKTYVAPFKKNVFQVTPKGFLSANLSSDGLNWLRACLLGLVLINLGGLALVFVGDAEALESNRSGTYVASAWALWVSVISFIAFRITLEKKRFRQTERFSIDERISMRDPDGQSLTDVTLWDISVSGCSIVGEWPAGEYELTIAGVGAVAADRVRTVQFEGGRNAITSFQFKPDGAARRKLVLKVFSKETQSGGRRK